MLTGPGILGAPRPSTSIAITVSRRGWTWGPPGGLACHGAWWLVSLAGWMPQSPSLRWVGQGECCNQSLSAICAGHAAVAYKEGDTCGVLAQPHGVQLGRAAGGGAAGCGLLCAAVTAPGALLHCLMDCGFEMFPFCPSTVNHAGDALNVPVCLWRPGAPRCYCSPMC